MCFFVFVVLLLLLFLCCYCCCCFFVGLFLLFCFVLFCFFLFFFGGGGGWDGIELGRGKAECIFPLKVTEVSFFFQPSFFQEQEKTPSIYFTRRSRWAAERYVNEPWGLFSLKSFCLFFVGGSTAEAEVMVSPLCLCVAARNIIIRQSWGPSVI